MRVLSGIQPTGRFHLGNYFGAIRQYIALQQNEQAFYFIADLHALTTIRNPAELRQFTQDAALDLLALGLDPAQATLFRQSDVPEVTELTWLLMTVTQMSLLEKCHAYKDKQSRGIAADAGLFTYPVLMAADILAYDSNLVPVGLDQVQHIEVTRDVAQRFNHIYQQEVFVLPEGHVIESTAKVPGTDGEKMSKSYGNTIEIFEPPKKLRKKFMSIKTDSTPVEQPKNPETDSVFALYKLFANDEEQAALAARYRAGGMGYGEAKEALSNKALEYFAQPRSRRAELEANPRQVEDILQAGARKARAKAQEVLGRARWVERRVEESSLQNAEFRVAFGFVPRLYSRSADPSGCHSAAVRAAYDSH
jgi:tryptophanyl-tRNA synthetase